MLIITLKYLGPSVSQLSLLFILTVVNSLTLFALSILLIRTAISLGENVTTIESWEIERHKTLVRRARHFGGVLEGPDGIMIPIKRQEFPYDIGIWNNIKAGMGGSANVLSWFWPLVATPSRDTSLDFETNGFEDPKLSWPPPDPDRIPRMMKKHDTEGPFTFQQQYTSAREEVEAFNRRQMEDLTLRQGRQGGAEIQRLKRFHDRLSPVDDDEDDLSDDAVSRKDVSEGEEAWKNSEGERLRDFGVDEEAEFYDEDDVPLAKLIQR
ncbi:DHHC zinc finger membrane protein [Paecilomyces variotii No. 5]|uniref:DHHC zinc finger membrane protein n=1 Tax=Byssochlamys spectabilis (strain No. 5 / NBRC 109023) TaxID=1356009 RepID=V5FH29_BYSSN|nr:DHHC zinc finger membrane protein [Paecilomyces variotii No. 5]